MRTKHLKHAILAISLSGMIATHAHAGDAPINTAIQPDAPAADFTKADLHVLFDHAGQPMQLAALSQQEMRETEGAWLPVVYRVGGGLSGMYGAGYGYLAGGGRNPYGFVGSAAAGFAGGVWSPVSGYRAAAGTFGGAFTSGAVGGYGSSRGWW